MENNTTKLVINLMQNVVDKLDEVSAKIDIKKENAKKPESDFLTDLRNDFKKLLLQQNNISKRIDASNKEVNNAIVSNKNSNQTHNYEYVLFGKDSPLNIRFLISMIAIVVISWSGIKYLPPYFSAQSQLQIERDNYQLFYNYLYLKQVESKYNDAQKLEVILNKIKKGDDQIHEEYNSLLTRYQKQLRKQELENELKKLQ